MRNMDKSLWEFWTRNVSSDALKTGGKSDQGSSATLVPQNIYTWEDFGLDTLPVNQVGEALRTEIVKKAQEPGTQDYDWSMTSWDISIYLKSALAHDTQQKHVINQKLWNCTIQTNRNPDRRKEQFSPLRYFNCSCLNIEFLQTHGNKG